MVSIADASTWVGTPGNWSSNGSPGWNGTGVPNSAGAVAEYLGGSSATITQDIALGVTVGTLRSGSSGNASLSITLTNPITFDQDGGGSGSALIENARTAAGTYRLNFSTGTFTLADNLTIRNSSPGASSSGSIALVGVNIGGTGNITFDNVSNNVAAGQIAMTSANTSNFTGNVLVRNGAVTFADLDNFGSQTTNVITLGESGQGSVTLVSSATVGTVVNNIVAASGTSGTSVLGSSSAAGSGNTTYSGTVSLNGNLSLTSSNTGTGHVTLSGIVSGTGDLTKIGAGIAKLSGVNTYTGNTTVSAGSLLLLSSSEERFKIQDANVSNKFLGTGAVDFGGILRLDITGLTATSGTWSLIDVTNLTETWGGSFSLAFVGGPTFTDAGGGNYTSGDWTFTKGTGNLVLVPEPATFGLLGLGGSLLLAIRRRRGAFAVR